MLNLKDLQMEADEVGESGSWVKVERMFIPPVEKEAEFFEGTPDEVASRIVEILRSRGLV